MILVTGGSGSGKSSYAEDCIIKLHKPSKQKDNLFYIATMKVYGEEGQRKVERHRNMREGKGFKTIEQTCDIDKCLTAVGSDKYNTCALLECMSNLVANEMFDNDTVRSEDYVVEKVLRDFSKLSVTINNLVVVTNNVFEDGCEYDEQTKAYIRALGRINVRLARMADKVVEVVVGIPIEIK